MQWLSLKYEKILENWSEKLLDVENELKMQPALPLLDEKKLKLEMNKAGIYAAVAVITVMKDVVGSH